MDFITLLPNSFGFTIIMVVIDRFTKYNNFVAMKINYIGKFVVATFMTNTIKLHGVPKSTVSYMDKVFTSNF